MSEWEWIFRARPTRVIDGDTYDMDIDLGLHVTRRERVRLWGVDTPERFNQRGMAATAFVRDWLAEHEHNGARWPFLIRTEKDKRTFGRYIARVMCSQRHVLGDALIDAGHVK